MTNSADGWERVQNPPIKRWMAGLAACLIVAYPLIGYFVLPPLLAPFGCAGFGDPAVGHSPATSFNITYSEESDDLIVTHSGGDTLPAERTDSLYIRIYAANSEAVRNYTWTNSGGKYPIQEGDSVTVQNPSVDNRSVTDGDTIRVIWRGTWEDPYPEYCPSSNEFPDRATLSKLVVEETSDR